MDMDNEFYKFIENNHTKCPGNIIFARVGGSQCYNLSLPTSDIDFSGVYFCRTKDLVGLDNIKETLGSNCLAIAKGGQSPLSNIVKRLVNTWPTSKLTVRLY